MTEWWMSLTSMGQVFACIAVPATLILLIQTVMMIIGIGGHTADDGCDGCGDTGDIDGDAGDIDGDFGSLEGGIDIDGDGIPDIPADANVPHMHAVETDGGLRLFTFRGIIAFFSVLGWAGVVCTDNGMKGFPAVLVALASGFAAMIAVALIMKWILSLQYDGTEKIRDFLGASGTVYIRIPGGRAGAGKVNVLVGERISEKAAVTDDPQDMMFGEEITVIGITGGDTLVVRRKNKKQSS